MVHNLHASRAVKEEDPPRAVRRNSLKKKTPTVPRGNRIDAGTPHAQWGRFQTLFFCLIGKEAMGVSESQMTLTRV